MNMLELHKPLPPAESAGAASDGDAFFRMPGHLLRRCHQISVGIFLDECQAFDLTPLQFAALSTLALAGPLDQASLGRYAALDRSTVAVVVRKLIARELLERQQGGRDRRSKLIAISHDGRALLNAVEASVGAVQRKLLAPLSADEGQMLTRLLGKLADENNTMSRAPQRRPRPA